MRRTRLMTLIVHIDLESVKVLPLLGGFLFGRCLLGRLLCGLGDYLVQSFHFSHGGGVTSFISPVILCSFDLWKTLVGHPAFSGVISIGGSDLGVNHSLGDVAHTRIITWPGVPDRSTFSEFFGGKFFWLCGTPALWGRIPAGVPFRNFLAENFFGFVGLQLCGAGFRQEYLFLEIRP